jgi:cytochrome c5
VSDTDTQEQAMPIKSFVALFGGLILVAIILIFIAIYLSGSIGPGTIVQKQRLTEVENRLQPVGQVNTNPNAVQSQPVKKGSTSKTMSGKEVYSNTCSACHGTGALGAPHFGSKAQWTSHAKKGLKTLVYHALDDFKQKPARGGNKSLSDKDVKNGVEYMLKKAHVFKLAKGK